MLGIGRGLGIELGIGLGLRLDIYGVVYFRLDFAGINLHGFRARTRAIRVKVRNVVGNSVSGRVIICVWAE